MGTILLRYKHIVLRILVKSDGKMLPLNGRTHDQEYLTNIDRLKVLISVYRPG